MCSLFFDIILEFVAPVELTSQTLESLAMHRGILFFDIFHFIRDCRE